ncbi:hypothetical protein Psch_01234 [Pelotomaculum schinkii]|uniref:Uncharacterized protein n=1 Tax=Pelotomaculum schinkii TaxID=78350 RepID=A0A4Y7RFW6_9FIRM|nr:Wadjet anti-phage system protein JetA family protein [Pelotomaculum schinkii]TEB07679.1 hypothetical protein Psch_01234 [Pelotomaculum schinkii]
MLQVWSFVKTLDKNALVWTSSKIPDNYELGLSRKIEEFVDTCEKYNAGLCFMQLSHRPINSIFRRYYYEPLFHYTGPVFQRPGQPFKRALRRGILFKIYDQYLLTSLGMERDVVIDVIVDYIEENWEEEGQFAGALDDEIWDESLDNPAGFRDRAAFVLRKLESCGWLSTETYNNYKQYVNINDYAITILDTLDKVRKNRQAEYQGFVYATYTLLYAEDVERQASLALEKAFEQTEQLLNGLKSLNHNIKRYIERVLAEKQPKDILKIHFEDYKQEILDRSYHRLKTSDNVFRYRPKIIKRINKWYHDPAWVTATAAQEVERGRQASQAEAEKEIYHRLDYIRQTYTGMDEILEEIDRRNVQYANASFLQLKYILNSSKDLEGQLLEILKYLAGLEATFLCSGVMTATVALLNPITYQGTERRKG